MDTSEEYILMCQKATEIQKMMITTDPLNYFAEIIDDYAMVEIYGGYFINQTIEILKKQGQGQQYVWLPRQDQLQDMLEMSVDQLVSTFIKDMTYRLMYINDLVLHHPPFTSMEQVWLVFVMLRLHNKVWKEDDWVILDD